MFSLTSTVASAKLTSKVRPHPFAPAPRTRFRSRDLERERFPTQKARYNEWIFSFFFLEAGTFFLGTKDKKVDYTRGKSSNDDDVNDDDANAGVYFFTPSRRKNAHASRAKVLARLDATEHARAETSRFRRRLFFSRTREGGGCVDFEFSSRKGGKKLGLVSSRRSLSMSNPTERALTEAPLSSPLQ